MGCAAGKELPAAPENFRYMCIYFMPPLKIKAVHSTPQVDAILSQTVTKLWPKVEGIYQEYGVFTIKLAGMWSFGMGGRMLADLRRLQCQMLQDLHSIGWDLVTTTDLSAGNGAQAWFFRRTEVKHASNHVFGLCPHFKDSLQLINADGNCIDLMENAVKKFYPKGLQNLKRIEEHIEFKLRGNPWSINKTDQNEGRILIFEAVKEFYGMGYRLYGTGDLGAKSDTLFFMADEKKRNQSAEYCLLAINRQDRMQLTGGPRQLAAVVEQTLNRCWQKGIQDVFTEHNTIEWKLRGTPWKADGSDAVASRFLMVHVLKDLHAAGWMVSVSLHLNSCETEKTAFIFKSCKPQQWDYFCIGFDGKDRMCMVEASGETQRTIQRVITESYQDGLQSVTMDFGAALFKLNGNPWSTWNNLHLSRSFLCHLLDAIENEGWTVVCSTDICAPYHTVGSKKHRRRVKCDSDCWFVGRLARA